jgi:small-conductance mechanosensitive channel
MKEYFEIVSQNVWVARLFIIVLYALIAKAADLFIDRVLRRLAGYTRISFDDQLITFFHPPLCWTIVLFGFLHAAALPPPHAEPLNTILPNLAQTVILFIWFVALLKLLGRVSEQSREKIISQGKIGHDMFFLLKNVVRVIVVISALLWLLSIWEMDLTPLFASAGIAGIAVALAAKDTLANFFGGISIFADKTFKVGDYIILDSAERGEVVEIGIRSTRIKTRDDVLVTIPNSILANSKIVNESAPVPRFRIRVPVGIAYGSDLDEVEEILLEVARKNPAVAEEPSPRVRVRTFGSSSVDFELLCWVDDPRLKGLEVHNLLKEIYAAFREKKVTIPFPQRDIYIKECPSGSLPTYD